MTADNTIYAMGYARVSTAKQAVESESLDIQADRIERHIIGHGRTVKPMDGVIQEPFTGTTDERPVYQEALRYIRKNRGTIRYFVVMTIDRFSREGAFKYQQMKAELAAEGVELGDISGVIQPRVNSLQHLGFKYGWSETSPSDVGEVVLAEAASHERSRILTRLVEAQIRLTQGGYHLGPANDGYVVKRVFVDGKKKLAQFPDPERAEFVRVMFRMRAEGTTSDEEIVKHLNGLGFRTKPFNRWNRAKTVVVGHKPGMPLTVKHFQCLIQRPAYCGITVRRWTHGKAVRARGGEALIPIAQFNAANRGRVFIEEHEDGSVRISYNHMPSRQPPKRHKFSLRWPLKNVVACPRCRKPLFASASRGKSGHYFTAYHCSRGHARYSVPQAKLEQAFSTFVATLHFEPKFFACFETLLVDAFHDAQAQWTNERRTSASKIATLEERKTQLALAFAETTSASVRKVLEQQVTALDDSISEVGQQHQAFGSAEGDVQTFLTYARTLLEHPQKILDNIEHLREQLAIYGLFFERPPTFDDIVFGTPLLRLTFALSRQVAMQQSRAVHRQSLDWNTLHQEIYRWNEAEWAIDAILRRLHLQDSAFAAA